MKTSHGVVQGYNGVAMVDSKHQVVVHAEATGQSETAILKPMVEETRENFSSIGKEEDIFKKTKLSGDTGFHSEKNMEMLIEQGIDAYIADNKFRHRDPRFADADRHKERFNKEVAKRFDRAIIFQPRDFTVSPDKSFCICPAGKRMYKCGSNIIHNGLHAIKYHGTKRDCIPCQVRAKCMKNPDVTVTRQFAHFTGKDRPKDKNLHAEDAGEDRLGSRQADLRKKNGDSRTRLCRHPGEPRPGSLQPQRQKEGQHPVAALLHCS